MKRTPKLITIKLSRRDLHIVVDAVRDMKQFDCHIPIKGWTDKDLCESLALNLRRFSPKGGFLRKRA